MKISARISKNGNYRYWLRWDWDDDKPTLIFAMLKPSTADASDDDPTIRRCVNYAKDWGYGSLYVLNLFAFRATDPKALNGIEDPVGPENDDAWKKAIRGVADDLKRNRKRAYQGVNFPALSIITLHKPTIVCGWGSAPIARGREAEIRRWLGIHTKQVNTIALELTKAGAPRHPLYVKRDIIPVPYTLRKGD